MNKIISTKERVFFSLVGPSGSGKSHLIFEWLKIGAFQPKFDKIFYFYQHYQPLYGQMQRKNLKFIQGVDFELIENLPNNGTKYLLIFDDSCEEILNSKQFVKSCMIRFGISFPEICSEKFINFELSSQIYIKIKELEYRLKNQQFLIDYIQKIQLT